MRSNCKPPERKPRRLRCRRLQYAQAVLKVGGFCTASTHVAALVAIMAGEGSKAHWNPMDTTRFETGATAYNSFGPGGEYHVWNYPSAHAGVSATVATLHQTNMAVLAEALRNKDLKAPAICRAFSRVPWAYIGDTLPEEIAIGYQRHTRDYKRDWSVLVEGPGDWPYPRGG